MPTIERRKPPRGSKILDYQKVQRTGGITLNKDCRTALDIKGGEWLVIYPGPEPGTVIMKKVPHMEFVDESDDK
jgi:bifunctional DNA-binding transcriptional regulator/antitoxin component of YhaV-PrlF toxin-antitoxin module